MPQAHHAKKVIDFGGEHAAFRRRLGRLRIQQVAVVCQALLDHSMRDVKAPLGYFEVSRQQIDVVLGCLGLPNERSDFAHDPLAAELVGIVQN